MNIKNVIFLVSIFGLGSVWGMKEIPNNFVSTGFFVNNNQQFILKRGNENFNFYLLHGAISLFKDSGLELGNFFKFSTECYVSLKGKDSKITGYVFFYKTKNNRDFKMDYYTESEFKKDSYLKQTFAQQENFFIRQSEIENKKYFELLAEPPFTFNAIHQEDNMFKGKNFRQFREAREKNKQRNLRKKNSGQKQQFSQNSNNFLKKDIDFDDLKIFLALNATEKNFESLFLKKVNSYNKTELMKLHNQLSQWDKKIDPEYKESYMHIYKNMYKEARSLVKLEIFKQSSFKKINSFFSKNSEENNIFKKTETTLTAKQLLNQFHSILVSV